LTYKQKKQQSPHPWNLPHFSIALLQHIGIAVKVKKKKTYL